MITKTCLRRLVVATSLAGALLAAQEPAVSAGTKKTLPRPEEIEGVPCKRSARFHDNGRLEACTLSSRTELRGPTLPAGTRVWFDADGALAGCFLAKHTEIEGHVCKGRGHGYQTTFHPNGRLKFCNLAAPEEIQGIPCQKSTFLIWTLVGNAGVTFHDNGGLRGCLLAEDLEIAGRSFRRGSRIELDRDGRPAPPETDAGRD